LVLSNLVLEFPARMEEQDVGGTLGWNLEEDIS
jgi:hypothetical protein